MTISGLPLPLLTVAIVAGEQGQIAAQDAACLVGLLEGKGQAGRGLASNLGQRCAATQCQTPPGCVLLMANHPVSQGPADLLLATRGFIRDPGGGFTHSHLHGKGAGLDWFRVVNFRVKKLSALRDKNGDQLQGDA